MVIGVSNPTLANRLLLNPYGNGVSFSVSALGGDLAQTSGVAVGDMNADGTLDIVVANSGSLDQLLAGDGSGGFTASDLPSYQGKMAARGVTVGDLDNDGSEQKAL